jgi:hypothetical protein
MAANRIKAFQNDFFKGTAGLRPATNRPIHSLAAICIEFLLSTPFATILSKYPVTTCMVL